MLIMMLIIIIIIWADSKWAHFHSFAGSSTRRRASAFGVATTELEQADESAAGSRSVSERVACCGRHVRGMRPPARDTRPTPWLSQAQHNSQPSINSLLSLFPWLWAYIWLETNLSLGGARASRPNRTEGPSIEHGTRTQRRATSQLREPMQLLRLRVSLTRRASQMACVREQLVFYAGAAVAATGDITLAQRMRTARKSNSCATSALRSLYSLAIFVARERMPHWKSVAVRCSTSLDLHLYHLNYKQS